MCFHLFQVEGYKYDPEGEYVRRWLPELSRLPTEWVHCPWDAPPNVLRAAGVELGSNYPQPIVNIGTARERLAAALGEMWASEAALKAGGLEEGLGETTAEGAGETEFSLFRLRFSFLMVLFSLGLETLPPSSVSFSALPDFGRCSVGCNSRRRPIVPDMASCLHPSFPRLLRKSPMKSRLVCRVFLSLILAVVMPRKSLWHLRWFFTTPSSQHALSNCWNKSRYVYLSGPLVPLFVSRPEIALNAVMLRDTLPG